MPRPRAARALVAACALVAVAGVGAGCRRAPPRPRLALTPCQLAVTGRPERAQAKCGRLKVPEDRAHPGGRTLELFVAVVPAQASRVASDPLFLIAGGPGQGLSNEFPRLQPLFARLNDRRDLVLVDQRGTGRSAPLECPKATVLDESPAQMAVRMRSCMAELQLRADLRQYGTAVAMDDLDEVRAALGYERINLYGGSYGTRAALAYLRQHPERVRALVLDGVAPPSWPIGPDVAPDGQRALDLHFARCAREPACAAAFPELPAAFQALLARLERAPVTVTVPHPVSAEATPVTLTRALLSSIVRVLSYSSETASLLPLLIHSAHRTGDFKPLAAQALQLEDLLSLAEGMHFSVLCAEDMPFVDLPAARQRAAGTYLGDAFVAAYDEVCRLWPRGELPAGFRDPVRSAAPVLVLSGEVDPVTPPRNGAAAVQTLGGAAHVVLPGEAHGIVYRGCVQRLVGEFLDRGTTAGLDTGCIAAHRPLAFFTSFRGPPP
jgi:pimeloyl-ACP methyl ester carboxylesterase